MKCSKSYAETFFILVIGGERGMELIIQIVRLCETIKAILCRIIQLNPRNGEPNSTMAKCKSKKLVLSFIPEPKTLKLL